MVNLPNTRTVCPQIELIELVVNPAAGTDNAPLEITRAQLTSLVIPALHAQGLDVIVRESGEPALEQFPPSVRLPLTWAGETEDADLDQILALCQDWPGLQGILKQAGFLTGPGDHWLPVASTEKGLLYGELIGQGQDGHYFQPIHVPDKIRQPLYYLTQYLLRELNVPFRGCCLVQVGWIEGELCFDRLWPFPIQPALASLGVQSPDLFYVHYLCCQGLPLKDLRIQGQAPYGELADLS
ncbi:hypothetical protein RIF25_02345 [Thermosynechococcaceae cyanobacterium BACA0444]|uniref:Uncharacterized protein n=1 Tax=Pseudocalidococcus azoricus BACA0444 TaxID=2918990 RepID=A0AAE4FP40_9CYAN|nr:hypothetical protein [Pseudocalidococcus azoricus]MDS3859639.1 hypothetical protein [Pseudocalidococcus azoricus BACA0444]